jgi:hypothetical protein
MKTDGVETRTTFTRTHARDDIAPGVAGAWLALDAGMGRTGTEAALAAVALTVNADAVDGGTGVLTGVLIALSMGTVAADIDPWCVGAVLLPVVAVAVGVEPKPGRRGAGRGVGSANGLPAAIGAGVAGTASMARPGAADTMVEGRVTGETVADMKGEGPRLNGSPPDGALGVRVAAVAGAIGTAGRGLANAFNALSTDDSDDVAALDDDGGGGTGVRFKVVTGVRGCSALVDPAMVAVAIAVAATWGERAATVDDGTDAADG